MLMATMDRNHIRPFNSTNVSQPTSIKSLWFLNALLLTGRWRVRMVLIPTKCGQTDRQTELDGIDGMM